MRSMHFSIKRDSLYERGLLSSLVESLRTDVEVSLNAFHLPKVISHKSTLNVKKEPTIMNAQSKEMLMQRWEKRSGRMSSASRRLESFSARILMLEDKPRVASGTAAIATIAAVRSGSVYQKPEKMRLRSSLPAELKIKMQQNNA